MADSKITALTSISTSTDPAVDPLVIVDVSDTSMAATGTTKKVTLNNLLSSSPTATGAFTVTGLVTAGSATITGDLTVDTSTLKVVSASDVVGINTASPLTGNDAGLTIGAIGTVKALNIGLQNTFARFREKDAVDGFAITTNITGANTQDDATKSSWKVRMGFANGNDNYVISRSNVGSTTFQDIYSLSTTSAIWSDGAGGTRMTLNSTGLGIGVAPVAYSDKSLTLYGSTTSELHLLTGNTGSLSSDGVSIGITSANELLIFNREAAAIRFGTNNTDVMRIDSSGNVLSNVTATPPTLATNSQMVFNLTSNTNLRISVRGTDGTTRVANITLA
jgi:hypothetical protein